MKIQKFLTFAACAVLLGNPVSKTFAADASPAPSMSPKVEKKADKPVDPDKEKWNAANRQAMADPSVKAAFDAAIKKKLEKVREIDPSLSARVDKEEERMKPKPQKPKPAKTVKPMKSPAKETPAASPTPNGAH